jgi:retron-type reverse transcriptase
MYDNIISLENLYDAWNEFVKDKRNKKDVSVFARYLDIHIYDLYLELKNKTYKHGGYKTFKINDPKPRDIHKTLVRDRLIHHAIYLILYPYFDKKFIHDSYSCRLNKGTHKSITRFEKFNRIVSKNYTKQCYVLKCDIKKFFANIDHYILKQILARHIADEDVLNLLGNIIDSFITNLPNHLYQEGIAQSSSLTKGEIERDFKGLPLGNLTSQILVNIYMNEFDQYMKHVLKVKYYIRYADDFVIISQDKIYLENLILDIEYFLNSKLKLNLHPNKVFIKTIYSGVDFLGWVTFPKYKVIRTTTKKRMFRTLNKNDYKNDSVQSYLGMLSHGDGHKTSLVIVNKRSKVEE